VLFIAAASVPFALICILFGDPLLSTIFGAPYGEASLPLAILAAGQIVNVAVGSVGLILNMTGHERDVVVASVVASAGNLALNFALVPHLGMTGSACATTASTVVINIMMFWAVKRRLNINMLPWPLGA